MIWKELTPLNAKFKPINAVNGGSVTLTVEGSFIANDPDSPLAEAERVPEVSFKVSYFKSATLSVSSSPVRRCSQFTSGRLKQPRGTGACDRMAMVKLMCGGGSHFFVCTQACCSP